MANTFTKMIMASGLVFTACVPNGSKPQTEPLDRSRPVQDTGVEQPHDVHGSCVAVHVGAEESARYRSKSSLAAGGLPLTVFLNRSGGTYSPGSNDSARNRSSIIGRSRTIPAYQRSDESWTALVDCVRQQFERFNVMVTDVEPSGGAYVEVVIGGRPSNLGISNGITGIAPIDTYSCSPIERAVAYVFERNIRSNRRVCETTAHEIGHTLSLEHEYLCKDPMTYLGGCGEKTFQDQEVMCGTGSRGRCRCRGGKQNTVQAMYSLLGARSGEPRPKPEDDTAAPVVEVLSPASGDTLTENTTIEVTATASDDQWLSRVELVWDYNGKRYGCPTSEQYVTCTRTDSTYTWRVDVSTGKRTFRVRAVDFVGKEAVTEDRTIHLSADGQPPPQAGDRAAPQITVVSPQAGDTGRPNSTISVVAEVSDEVEVDKVQLIWDFNGVTYECPRNQQYVRCEVNGARYEWQVDVGVEDDRTFTVRAFDTAGNVATSAPRTIQIVRDKTPPTVTLLEPSTGAALPVDSEIQVVAEVDDASGVAEVELIWDYNGYEYPCPHRSTYVDCDVNGSRYEWSVRVSTGKRRYRVRATDSDGNTTTSPDNNITLQ